MGRLSTPHNVAQFVFLASICHNLPASASQVLVSKWYELSIAQDLRDHESLELHSAEVWSLEGRTGRVSDAPGTQKQNVSSQAEGGSKSIGPRESLSKRPLPAVHLLPLFAKTERNI